MSSHARTLTCSSLQTGAWAKEWTWSITYSSKCMLPLSSRFIWNALSHARLFNIMSCHATFESSALMMYRPVLKYSSPHFARQFFAFFLISIIPRMRACQWHRRPAETSLFLLFFLFSVFSSYFSFSAALGVVEGSGFWRRRYWKQTNTPRLFYTPVWHKAKLTSPPTGWRN